MTIEERTLSRILFENKIRRSDGNAFEELFTQIMNYAEPDFEQIKPWGNIGDRKNDGFIRSKGIFFQVFAPEDIDKSYPEAISKIENDFNGLISHWNPINEFYFVVNDKYKGVNADSNNKIENIVKTHNLKDGRILTASYLENLVFKLPDDQILKIVSFLPNLENLSNLDFSVTTQVIGYIMKLDVKPLNGQIKYPDWNDKIEFNKLGVSSKQFLDMASINLGALNDFLSNENFLAEELQRKLIGLYDDLKKEFQGDNLFWEMTYNCMPNNQQCFLTPTLTIMSKYFESCDIFEEPTK